MQNHNLISERDARMSIDSSASESMPATDLVSWPSNVAPAITRPVPPPPTRPRRADIQNKVVYPQKDACQKYVIVLNSLHTYLISI